LHIFLQFFTLSNSPLASVPSPNAEHAMLTTLSPSVSTRFHEYARHFLTSPNSVVVVVVVIVVVVVVLTDVVVVLLMLVVLVLVTEVVVVDDTVEVLVDVMLVVVVLLALVVLVVVIEVEVVLLTLVVLVTVEVVGGGAGVGAAGVAQTIAPEQHRLAAAANSANVGTFGVAPPPA